MGAIIDDGDAVDLDVERAQRRPHIGGALGAALLEVYLAQGWILRIRGSRAVSLTPKGTEAFRTFIA